MERKCHFKVRLICNQAHLVLSMTESTIYRRRVAGDPKECRKHALRCRELAYSLPEGRPRQAFTHLAESWLQLAAQVENGHALLDSFSAVTPKPHVEATIHSIGSKSVVFPAGGSNG